MVLVPDATVTGMRDGIGVLRRFGFAVVCSAWVVQSAVNVIENSRTTWPFFLVQAYLWLVIGSTVYSLSADSSV